jgi:non-specific serine/threonine protein kinase/serine/threonine-protein kinase
MTPEHWQRVKSILQGALERPREERERYIQDSCAGDTAMLSEVADLLRYEDQPGFAPDITQWRQALPEDEFADEQIPERAGPYRILRRLGEGGMGVVYLAERDDGEYRQQVAVKVVKSGPHAASFARRFRREREVLAELEHPHIARLIDSGTTAGGRLFYVMEYVDGLPVTKYANEHRLNVRLRLRLFCNICSAVAHAHSRLIVHGDIKPANILVNAAGQPKLLDFGLAQVFRDSPGGTAAPASTVAMLTPEYASPEQVRGERPATAADIYSLGVVLYELLTGARPYVTKSQSPLEAYRAICEVEPSRPSLTVRRAGPDSPSPALSQQLKGDLDDIVLMALRKESAQRYASVADFQRDIERHLGGFPVLASRGSRLYRARKFVARHAWGVAVAALGTLLSLAAGALIWWEGWQARRHFNDLRQLAHAVVFDLHDAIQDLPGSTGARQLLVERALVYLKNLDATGGNNRDLQLELALAYGKIGEVQGSPGRANLGDLAGALVSYRRACEILRQLHRATPSDVQVQQELARMTEGLADIYELRAEMAAWRATRSETKALRWDLARTHPEVAAYRAKALLSDAYTLSGERQFAAAAQAYEKALAATDEVVRRDPGNREWTRELARVRRNLARSYHDSGQTGPALENYQEARRMDAARLAAAPRDMRVKMELSWDYAEIGWILHERHDDREAEQNFAQALDLQQQMSDADPQNLLARLEIGKLKMTAAPASEAAGDRKLAIQYMRDAIAIFQEALQRDATNDDARFHLAQTWSNLGDTYWRRAAPGDPRWKQATTCFDHSMRQLEMLKMDGRPKGGLDPRPLRRHVVACLAECRARRP